MSKRRKRKKKEVPNDPLVQEIMAWIIKGLEDGSIQSGKEGLMDVTTTIECAKRERSKWMAFLQRSGCPEALEDREKYCQLCEELAASNVSADLCIALSDVVKQRAMANRRSKYN